ncbi:hypothetical protein SXCC_03108 [Gluconacetobacter sp. SXCC-1]|nr:hypothetical protein SXCC_03108 [Gluconacetobacter sp. SXCC-1]
MSTLLPAPVPPVFPHPRSAGAYRAMSPACPACGAACAHADPHKALPA